MASTVETFLKIIIAIIIPNIGGWVGARITFKNLDWFKTLKQPKFSPPNWLFGPAWTILYSSIGFASYLVYNDLQATGNGFDLTALISILVYILQLFHNWIWTPIFFGFHSLKWSSVDIVLTLIAAVINAIVFGYTSPLAGYLFLPYIVWLIYASYLNISLLILNKDEIILPASSHK